MHDARHRVPSEPIVAACLRGTLPRVTRWAVLALLACVGAAGAAPDARARASDQRPNILLILADDLGYSDIGPFGSEIPTPNLDALAAAGRVMTSLYATSMPISRAEVLTGADHHRVGVGSMEPARRRQIGQPGYRGHLTDDSLPVSQVLLDHGYHTYMVGTWHLGTEREQGPRARGFESSFSLLGAAGMFFPPRRDQPLPSGAEEWPVYRKDEAVVSAPDAYITDYFTDELISYIDKNRKDGKPFFAYASYTSPHFPLQAPAETLARHRGRYDRGYDDVRLARIARQRQLGILPRDLQAGDPVPVTRGYPTWAQLSDEDRRVEARRMEVYAAMIENLDQNIGRLIAYLRKTGLYDNTFILFTSGNGAAQGLNGYREHLDVEAMGGPESWIFYSERWAEVSNAPFRLWKAKPTEGGISVPGIVRLPHSNRAGPAIRAIATLKDLAPTFLDLAGVPAPGATYKGRAVVPMSGASLLPMLSGRADAAHPPDAVFADEQSGEGYVRQGRWKAVRMTDTAINLLEPGDPVGNRYMSAMEAGDDAALARVEAEHPFVWSLYDIEADRGERRDLAASEPLLLQRMQKLYEEYKRAAGVIDW